MTGDLAPLAPRPPAYREVRGTQRHMIAFDSGWLEPGSSCTRVQRVAEPCRCDRLMVTLTPRRPELHYFTQRVGGSRRKGQRASWLFHAEVLCHPHRTARISIDSITINGAHQLSPLGPAAGALFPA